MIDYKQVSALIVEAVALDDAVATVVQTADDNWVVRFESVDVEIGVDAERERLILVTTLGVPAADRRLAVLEVLLSYNFLVRETGGVRIAMTGTSGDVVQMVDIGLGGLLPRDLAVALTNMADKTLVWRAFVASAGADIATPAPAPKDSVTLRI